MFKKINESYFEASSYSPSSKVMGKKKKENGRKVEKENKEVGEGNKVKTGRMGTLHWKGALGNG